MAQLKASPNDASILGDIADMYSLLGDTPQAIDFMNRALAINHTDSGLMFNAAQIYNQLHQTGPALEWLDKALARRLPTVRGCEGPGIGQPPLQSALPAAHAINATSTLVNFRGTRWETRSRSSVEKGGKVIPGAAVQMAEPRRSGEK